MSFNNFLTPVWLAPGGTHYWWYTFYDNRGVQIAMADMKTPGAKCVTVDFGKQLETSGAATYFVTIRNDGPQWVYYNLHGGGVV